MKRISALLFCSAMLFSSTGCNCVRATSNWIFGTDYYARCNQHPQYGPQGIWGARGPEYGCSQCTGGYYDGGYPQEMYAPPMQSYGGGCEQCNQNQIGPGQPMYAPQGGPTPPPSNLVPDPNLGPQGHKPDTSTPVSFTPHRALPLGPHRHYPRAPQLRPVSYAPNQRY